MGLVRAARDARHRVHALGRRRHHAGARRPRLSLRPRGERRAGAQVAHHGSLDGASRRPPVLDQRLVFERAVRGHLVPPGVNDGPHLRDARRFGRVRLALPDGALSVPAGDLESSLALLGVLHDYAGVVTMRARVPALVAISISVACSNDMSVHVRGGDRPPNPEELVFSYGVVSSSGGLLVNGGVTVDRFQIVLRSMRLQEAPTDGGPDAPGAEYFGPGPYLVDLLGPGLGGGTFTELVSKYIVGPKSYYEMDMNLQPVSASDVELAPALAPLQGKTFRITGTNAQKVPFTFESTM